MMQNSPCWRDALVRHSKHCQRENYLYKEDACQGYTESSLTLPVSQNHSWTVTADHPRNEPQVFF